MDSHEWMTGDVECRVDRILHPEGIFTSTGEPLTAEALGDEVLRLAEQCKEMADVLEEAVLWASVQTGNCRSSADTYFADQARAALRKAGRLP